MTSEVMPGGRRWPRISIVTPSFNQGAFIEQAIRSVLLQGYPDLELIVVDGGSSDGTRPVLQKYEPWMTHCVSERDNGPADALNKGFNLATGEIFAFLNADDFYLPGCLVKAACEFRSHPSVDVVSGHGYLARASGKIGAPIFSDGWDLGRFAYGTCVLVQQSTFFRRLAFELARGFRVDKRTTWDMELWADMALAGAVFHSMNDFMAVFRLHANSISGSRRWRAQRTRDTRAIFAKIRGRSDQMLDRVHEFALRTRKFADHPLRTLNQRFFLLSTLKRWSL